ncbi:DNA replication/repair protein RecF [Paraglaciecola aquimarina]|uniref:DNA replication and repair protein RecF n=1 Tax=Paraglaciecola algarum TaxID=3050085 RepID=A0ABS9D2T5_9ALTE|nr:DNA replication/repair protein RecF [Paraglaciecola sp. G1-23]MCF2947196.1 DNA replication/repair protein RecF [Paraglaciecola sp. G1-23]
MKLDKVQISNFRNFKDLSFSPNSKLNVFIGENGTGKSSILEALHYLGFARSFRTSKHKNVIKAGESEFTVFCSSIDVLQKQQRFGIFRSSEDVCIVNIDGVKSRRATDLVSCLPVQIFTPQSSDLLIGAPKLRRSYLDWLLFHVEHSFSVDAQNFKRSLKQLNALYRNQTVNSNYDYWIDLFVAKGEWLTQVRTELLNERLIDAIKSNLADFLPEFSFEISYYRGWEKGLSLKEALEKNKEKDKKNGYVSSGPHKADLKIKSQGLAAQELLSRGQLRMLVAALQLAQTQYLQQATAKTSIFLLDDIGAELDREKRKVFINKLSQSGSQLFVTAIDVKQLDFLNNYNEKTVFHVEHGQVKEEI